MEGLRGNDVDFLGKKFFVCGNGWNVTYIKKVNIHWLTRLMLIDTKAFLFELCHLVIFFICTKVENHVPFRHGGWVPKALSGICLGKFPEALFFFWIFVNREEV